MTGNTVTDSNGNVISATPSHWSNNPDRPVEQVSWNDIQVFLTRLNDQEAGNIPAGWAYVLPTEAQWEYACRAGTTTAYSWGDEITSDDANYNWDQLSNTGVDFKQTRDVGQYYANSWGFFDMHGNIAEWTADWYQTYSVGNLTMTELLVHLRGYIEFTGVLHGTMALWFCVQLHANKRFPNRPEPRYRLPSRLDGFK